MFRNFRRSVFLWTKRFAQRMRPISNDRKLLFILGCQRSGTTLLSQIFEKDWHAKSYSERSSITSDDNEFGIRLNSLSKVEAEFNCLSSPFVVIKPLVESQRALELLDYFSNSRALWIYRNYKDVAASNIKKFGIENGISDIRQLLSTDSGNWRSEVVPPDVSKLIHQFYSKEMNPYDAAVLFWYARNSLFFHLELDQRPEVMLCKYETLVKQPEIVVPDIYEFSGRKYPGPSLIREIHARSVKKGSSIDVSPKIALHAEALLARLDAAWDATRSARQ